TPGTGSADATGGPLSSARALAKRAQSQQSAERSGSTLTEHRGREAPTRQEGRSARPARSRSARKANRAPSGAAQRSLNTGDGERRPVRRAAELGPRAREARAKQTEPVEALCPRGL